MMFQKSRNGKGVLALLVMVFGLAALAGSALEVSEQDAAWWSLARGKADEALRETVGPHDDQAVWIETVARLRGGRDEVSGDLAAGRAGRISAAAAAFESRRFDIAFAILDSLPANEAADSGQLFLLARLGACQLELGRIDEAEQTLTSVIEHPLAGDLPVLRCYALLTRGRERVRTRQVDPPRRDLLAARELAVQLEMHSWAGTAAIALSVVSRLQMDLDDALRWRETALDDYQTAGDLGGQARALQYIATIKTMQGDLTRSLTMLQDALALARRDGDEAVAGGIQGTMAGINYLLGNFDQALVEYEEAVRLAGSPRRRGMMLMNMGSIHEYRGQYDEAVVVLQQAQQLLQAAGDHRSEAMALAALGKTSLADGIPEAGLAYLDRALAMSREYQVPMMEAYALAVKGHGLLDQGQVRAAAAALDTATVVARRIDYFDVLGWSLLGQARVDRREGRLDEALAHLQEALAEIDELKRRSTGASAVTSGIVGQAGALFDETIDLYHELYRERGDAQLAAAAFGVAQQAKARAFLDLLAEAEYDLRYSAVPGYREREAETLSRTVAVEQALSEARQAGAPTDTLTALQARLAGAENELRLLEAELREAEPGYADVLYPEPMSPAELGGDVLAPGEIFLEYALGDSASYLWLVDDREVVFTRLPPRREVIAAVRDVLPLLADYNLTGGEPAWYTPPAYALYEMLLGPVADRLAGARHLIISPDEILHYLPFEALPVGDGPAAHFGEVPYLVTQKVISYTPAAGVLAQLRRPNTDSPAASSRWLLVGDPVLLEAAEAGVLARAAGATDLPALPHAGRELRDLAVLAPAGAEVLTAEAASWTGLEQASGAATYSLVHFATHGLYNETRPRYSGLVISPDPAAGQDGFLSVSEVLSLRLPCEQVVLSACATALGETITGEGIASLNRSFLFAGARSVVSALWDVSDEATATLMTAYYLRLAGQATVRAPALAEVKRDFVAGRIAAPDGGPDWAHPAFWAGFVLNGDGR